MALEKEVFENVSLQNRDSCLNITMIWLGSMICVPSLLEGGAKVGLLSPGGIFWTSLVGLLILSVVIYFQGSQGADLGLPTDKLAESSFGKKGGGFIVSSVISISLIGWFGVQTAITGKAIVEILSFSDITAPVVPISIISGLLMMTNAIYGYKSMVILNKISVPALLLLCTYAVYSSYTELGIGDKVAFREWFILKDSFKSFLWGVDFTVGGLIVGATKSAHYTRFAHSRKDVAISGALGIIPVGVSLAVVGAMMTIATGTADLTIVLGKMGQPVIALLVLVLATWTTNVDNAYSGGLSLTNMLGLSSDKRYIATIIAGIIGIILAITGILDYFIDFLLLLTKGVTPVAGVMISDYWIKSKGKASNWHAKKDWYLPGIGAWALGFAVNYFVPWGSQSFNSVLTAGVAYLIFVKVEKINNSRNKQDPNPMEEQ